MEDSHYFLAVFNYDREGLRHIGERIINLLDWRSLIQFKRSCSLVSSFLHNNGLLEKRVLARKLMKDWSVGEPELSELGLKSNTAVTNVKIIHEGRDLLVSIGKCVHLFSSSLLEKYPNYQNSSPSTTSSTVKEGLKLKLRLPSTSLNSKINASFSGISGEEIACKTFTNVNDNLEKNSITQFDILNNCLIAGNNNGILSVWDFDSTELLISKQLFGIITGLSCIPSEDSIVTIHAGKAFDMGVVTVRRMVSPTELVVLWSVYQDVMPVFDFHVTTKWIVTLEWLGTFDLVHVGSASVYSRGDSVYTRRDLTEGDNSLQKLKHSRFTAATIFRDDFLALASDDGFSLVIWELTSLTPLQVLGAHTSAIVQIQACGERLVSLDKSGSIVIWNSILASDSSYVQDEDFTVLLRRLDLGRQDDIIRLDMDLRRLAVAGIGAVTLLDFWDTAGVDRNVIEDSELSR